MPLWSIPEARLVVWGGFLNGLWELAQSPLYTDHDRGWWYVTWTRFHCTLGDVMILLGAFWAVSLVFHSRSWAGAVRRTPQIVFVLAGLGYTVLSEWWNTTIRESWQYADAMPVCLGIGLSPIAQWIVVPPLVLLLIRSPAGSIPFQRHHSGGTLNDPVIGEERSTSGNQESPKEPSR